MKKNKKIRVCILMNRFHIGANILLNAIIDDPNIEIVGIVRKDVWATKKKKSEQGLFSAWMSWGARVGHYFLLALASLTLLHFLHLFLLEIFLIGFLFTKQKFLKTTWRLAWENDIPLLSTHDINCLETREEIAALKPDILLSNNFHQILKKEVLSLPHIGSINAHPGKLPLYRGMLPHFWAMLDGRKKLGVTLHEIDTGVDTGRIFSEKHFRFRPKETFYRVWQKTALCNAKLLKNFFSRLRRKKRVSLKIQKTSHKAKTFSFPTEKEYSRFQSQGRKLFSLCDFLP